MAFPTGRLSRVLGPALSRFRMSYLSTTSHSYKFWEPDKKGGYQTRINRPTKVLIREGLTQLRGEFGKLKDETYMKIIQDPIIDLRPGDFETFWKFDKEDHIKNWVVTTDSDHNEGRTKAEFILGKNRTGCFKGVVNTELPKDGVTKKAGYANIKSPRNKKSFSRFVPYDWSPYTHLTLRVRGDGRTYLITLQMDRYFDVQWNDQYHYMLYTRGGPYWQDVQIPFSKFFLSGKGRIQDKQETVMNQLHQISFLGITLGDDNPGPFNLEVDSIGAIFDASHIEKFAYEMYQCNPAVHS